MSAAQNFSLAKKWLLIIMFWLFNLVNHDDFIQTVANIPKFIPHFGEMQH